MKFSTRPATRHLGSLDSCQYDYLCAVFLDFPYFLHQTLGCEPKINNNGASFFSVLAFRQAHISSCLFFSVFLALLLLMFCSERREKIHRYMFGYTIDFQCLSRLCRTCAYVSALSMSICHLPTRCERFFQLWLLQKYFGKDFFAEKACREWVEWGKGGELKFNSHFNHRWAEFVEPRPDRST